ncbi:hypothetical protein AURDEDRAFT_164251 [Auricularia subglabra TFB-10046 SS5]|nr:hypothetical protein AURDEDRAFT_164251 [Auricularia subglabra TFB-10046 SS5]
MSTQSREYTRTSVALAGASLTTQIALAAADGIPVVKQVLGVASHIIKLAEKMEKNREVFLALVENAKMLEPAVRDRALNGEMSRSLEVVLIVLRSVESLLVKHAAKSPFHKALSYFFTVSGQVDRLSRTLDSAVQQFLVVSSINTNALVHGNAWCDGTFRLFRHFELDKLELVFNEVSEDGTYTVKYYSARLEAGQLCVVRYCEGNDATTAAARRKYDDFLPDRVLHHTSILEKMSTFQRSHRHVARIYGYSSEDSNSRFTVLKSGKYTRLVSKQLVMFAR